MARVAANLAVLVGPKGRGSNMRAIHRACLTGQISARINLLVSPVDGNLASQYAKENGIPLAILDPKSPDFPQKLESALSEAHIEWICLAGYLRLLPQAVVQAYARHILNIHPALLPRHGGKGMYGHHVHQAVLDAKDEQSGCTVHFVDEHYDSGQIILQRTVPVLPSDTPETLAERVLEQEHIAYVQALQKVLSGS